ncbi:MAG: hsp70 family protein [Desulfobacula sp.]|uniref:Hsp70 family protein n=1 Tax=Desulfobacula sp. TaxID=2593537 RepID=UPI0025C2202E|nr:Hsp70 family protein [Desulfobacula sp.]MCD4723106.1 hsp70 family protein [Desulfobacula sp.]
MDFQDKRYVIGIDLGTTNSAVSYVDVAALKDDKSTGKKLFEKRNLVKIFNISQLTGHGEFTKIPVLPSFLYIPGEYDISKEGLKHPWKKREDLFAGSFARDHGSKIPSRLVSSAKSWLCNQRVDRRAKVLPWGSEGFEKVSPVTATSQYLLHIRNAWNHYVKDEDKFLENQFVVITVPASFNEEARDLTMEAMRIAGFGPSVTLLEEPLAAFYSWLIHHEKDWQKHVKPDDLILVCDVGGGTTDFSLISLKESEGTPRFERIAVGDHLILGGDNIDLALARKIESKFKSRNQLTSDKWKTLCHRCREAKEKILDKGESSVRITLKGEGRSLIAGTLAADLTKEDIETILLDEFYPYVESAESLNIDSGKEITDFGLPFEKESAVTRHIIRFLENHRDDVRKNLAKNPLPDFILFNGGTLKPVLVQERIRQAIGKWFKASESQLPQILENNIPELAVGIGASYYGLVKQGEGVRVGSGSPRSYYIRVSVREEKFAKAVCIIERGLDEGSVIDLAQVKYEVRANEPVSFDIYYSSYRNGDKAGEIITIDDSFSSMTPIQTIIKFGKNGRRKIIPVTIGAEYTEMGTLSMYCHSGVSDHKWKLQFQLRDMENGVESRETQIYDEALIKDACNRIHQVFTDESDENNALKSIAKQIEKIVGQTKLNWPLSFLRSIADKLLELENTRNHTAEHEAKWLNLTGFCIRPGFGDAFDEERVRKLWKIYLAGLKFEKIVQNRLEWWIFIRRIAAGLKAGQQRQFFQDILSLLIKGKTSKSKISPQEQVELWMAAGNMERLLVKDKVVLAKYLLPLLKPGKKQDNMFWTLSRLGARELLYGSVDRVVPAKEVIKWINQVMKKKWQKNDPVENMNVQVSRKTGDRTRDIDQEDVLRIIDWMHKRKAKDFFIRVINEKIDMAVQEKNAQFGEKLPAGLVLRQ